MSTLLHARIAENLAAQHYAYEAIDDQLSSYRRIKISAQCPFVSLDLQRVTKGRRETLKAAQNDGRKLRRSMEHFWEYHTHHADKPLTLHHCQETLDNQGQKRIWRQLQHLWTDLR